MKTYSLSPRQQHILYMFEKQENMTIQDILSVINTTKVTINRDLKDLVENRYVEQHGKSRTTYYTLSPQYQIIKPVDIEKYFSEEIDKRKIRKGFNFDIFQYISGIFTEKELEYFTKLNTEYQQHITSLSPILLKKEYERLTIDLSWKSSKIEGNTYSLLETEKLLLHKEESKNHTKEEAIMIINHKKALDYIRAHTKDFSHLTVKKIEDIHSLLIKDLNVQRNIRKHPVGIIGTNYKPLDNTFQIKEALENMCKAVNKKMDGFSKSLWVFTLIAYIQPFEDGNKRTSRLLTNAVLLANNIAPLSYRSIDEIEYKKAIILFYEQNNISYLKKLFMEQLEFATGNYIF